MGFDLHKKSVGKSVDWLLRDENSNLKCTKTLKLDSVYSPRSFEGNLR